ncbi:MAG TPA: hypothetical protein VMY88_12915 [Acidimicrobiales bacterium]|nr:hypothetical protein [Acidimicrobiales bacterium]
MDRLGVSGPGGCDVDFVPVERGAGTVGIGVEAELDYIRIAAPSRGQRCVGGVVCLGPHELRSLIAGHVRRVQAVGPYAHRLATKACGVPFGRGFGHRRREGAGENAEKIRVRGSQGDLHSALVTDHDPDELAPRRLILGRDVTVELGVAQDGRETLGRSAGVLRRRDPSQREHDVLRADRVTVREPHALADAQRQPRSTVGHQPRVDHRGQEISRLRVSRQQRGAQGSRDQVAGGFVDVAWVDRTGRRDANAQHAPCIRLNHGLAESRAFIVTAGQQ